MDYERNLTWWLEHGDSAELLQTMPIGCVDALVTDPPAGISFMGREWDGAWTRPVDRLAARHPRRVPPRGETLDEQSGHLTSGSMGITTRKRPDSGILGTMPSQTKNAVVGDSGTASRFFYVAKPSTRERSAGMLPGARNTHGSNTKAPGAAMRLIRCSMSAVALTEADHVEIAMHRLAHAASQVLEPSLVKRSRKIKPAAVGADHPTP